MAAKNIRRSRRGTQVLFLMFITLLPILDLFRLDMAESRFVILGKYFFINQLYLALIAFILSILVLALFARNFGRIFCGWLCFQTFWSELGDSIIKKWRKLKKSRSKKTKIKHLIQIISLFFIVFPLMWGFYTVLVSYFVAPKVIWSWVNLGPPIWFLVLGVKFSVFGLIDLLVIRHSFCQSMCPYGIMQQKAKKNTSLRIVFDPNQCIDCNLCDQACLMGLKPRELSKEDPCINCAECITACGIKAEKLASRGIEKGSINSLSFAFQSIGPESKKPSIFDGKTLILGSIFVLFTAILLLGVMLDDGVDLTIKMKGDTAVSTVTSSESVLYDLQITNRTQSTMNFKIMLESVENGSSPNGDGKSNHFEINPQLFEVQPLTKLEQEVSISPKGTLPSGRYTMLLRLVDSSGREVDQTKTVYYVY
ncbi:4Fe-4S binding protein [Microaerobacter geothermalis]|uniref:4Fe-4S binding protein n=1 Tax=Microaerobacter geothermalis TaxID=674972 RepID=UPI001F361AAE|nr:4Fe-4S binding protein [Microaerobacter geothermalis]MCF6093017.1 4Fe-4S binding protein [Microaerobacter geothermalis]